MNIQYYHHNKTCYDNKYTVGVEVPKRDDLIFLVAHRMKEKFMTINLGFFKTRLKKGENYSKKIGREIVDKNIKKMEFNVRTIVFDENQIKISFINDKHLITLQTHTKSDRVYLIDYLDISRIEE